MAKKKKRRRVNVARLLILVLCFLLIIGLAVYGIKKIFFKPEETVVQEEKNSKADTNVEKIIEAGFNEEQAKELISLSNYWPDRLDRYVSYYNGDMKQSVMDVNCDMDLEPYQQTTIVKDDDDPAYLVNKFYALEDGYVPDDLVDLDTFACVQGQDYSCQDVDQIQLRKEAKDAYIEWCKAAQKENLEIRAISGYRTYEYQKGLWDYNASVNGEEYADAYYARPGQSEHNTGLAVDITFNGYNFNEIENYDGYEWILENAHKYGFILRYPEDKTDVTQYGYESWHFRYVGKEVAKKIYKNNWTLEEYYGAKEA